MWPCCRSGCCGGSGGYIPLTEGDHSDSTSSSPVVVRPRVPSPIPPRTAHSVLEIGFDIIRSGTNLVLFCLRRPDVTTRTSRVAANLTSPTSSTAIVPGDTDLLHAMLYMVQGASHVGLLLVDPACRRRRWRLIRAGLSATAVAHALLEILENERLLRSQSVNHLSPEERMQRMALMFSDVVFLVYEGYYFIGAAVRHAHNRVRHIADRRDGVLQDAGRLLLRIHRAFHRRIRQTANLVGAAGLTMAATLSATATVQALNTEGSHSTIEAAVLATQTIVMAAAATAFGWMFARNADRSRQ